MAFKQKIYIAGPRMGQNNTMKGIELADLKKKALRPSKKNKSSRRKK
jgi:hypothetical protein